MNLLFVAAESSPFIKTGGLGDVIGALPKSLVSKSNDVRVVIPYYSKIKRDNENIKFLKYFFIDLGFKRLYVGVFETIIDGVTYYLIDNEQYFKRDNIYGEFDDAQRFAFFSKAVIDLLVEINYKPDIINANDWHTALVPIYLDLYKKNQVEFYKNIKSVISIHNIEFQGKFSIECLGSVFGLDSSYYNILYYGDCLNLLKGAIQTADVITTVSKTYAKEILSPYFSYGLSDILLKEQHKIFGIVNGIDTELFNPATDKFISSNFTVNKLNKRLENKLKLQQELGLEVNKDIPLVVMIGRLTHQKGIDLLLGVFDEIMQLGVELVIVGTGDQYYERKLLEKQNYFNRFKACITFSNELAQKLYAASDIFLMPSKAEPCGLAQLIAMRYGSIPVVHHIGGLKDTIIPFNVETKDGNGFTFQSFNAHDMLDALRRAINIYHENFSILIKNAMKVDSSWKKSAKEYLKIYNDLLKK